MSIVYLFKWNPALGLARAGRTVLGPGPGVTGHETNLSRRSDPPGTARSRRKARIMSAACVRAGTTEFAPMTAESSIRWAYAFVRMRLRKEHTYEEIIFLDQQLYLWVIQNNFGVRVNAGTILDTLCENFACFVAFLLFFLCKFSEMITVLPCTFVNVDCWMLITTKTHIIMPILCKIEAVEMETKKIFFWKNVVILTATYFVLKIILHYKNAYNVTIPMYIKWRFLKEFFVQYYLFKNKFSLFLCMYI